MENDSTSTELPRTGESNANEPAGSSQIIHNEQTPVQKRAHAQTKKRLEFISSLNAQLDTIIYVELCIVYYMDCSFFRLILRVLCQMMFLTPKPAFIPPAPQHRPYIGAIFGPNIICILLHIFTARSEAGEAMRGYLHGGVIIDLIGQKGPTSKIHLVLLDILVLVLQCFMLAVHVEKEKTQSVLTGPRGSVDVDQPRTSIVTPQNHDAEEQGIIITRTENGALVRRTGDIELQSLNAHEEGPSAYDGASSERNEQREQLLAEPPASREVDGSDSLSMLWSGMSIVSEFHVMQNLRTQWNDYGSATGSALQTVGFNAEFANVVGRRRLDDASARFQRGVESLSV